MDRRTEFWLSQLHLDALHSEYLKSERYGNSSMVIFIILFATFLIFVGNIFKLSLATQIPGVVISGTIAIIFAVTVLLPADKVAKATKGQWKAAEAQHTKEFPSNE